MRKSNKSPAKNLSRSNSNSKDTGTGGKRSRTHSQTQSSQNSAAQSPSVNTFRKVVQLFTASHIMGNLLHNKIFHFPNLFSTSNFIVINHTFIYRDKKKYIYILYCISFYSCHINYFHHIKKRKKMKYKSVILITLLIFVAPSSIRKRHG